MERYFNKSVVLTGDCYVADYTNLSNSEKGVTLSVVPFTDINYFHLKKANKNNIRYLAVSFEDYPSFIKGIENCECVFNAISDSNKSWILFLELKYCKEYNVENYVYKAYAQMKETFERLKEMQLIDPLKKIVYFVYASPGNDNRQPFGASTVAQNDVLSAYKESGINLLGVNQMLIATPKCLFPGKIRV